MKEQTARCLYSLQEYQKVICPARDYRKEKRKWQEGVGWS